MNRLRMHHLGCGWLSTSLVVLLTTLAGQARSQDHSDAWQGRIGSAAVMVCLTADGHGEYYYLNHHVGISLRHRNEADPERSRERLVESMRAGQWTLDEHGLTPPGQPVVVTGRWQLRAQDSRTLIGQWTDPAGQRMRPIQLSRLPSTDATPQQDWACPPAFYDPLGQNLSVKRSHATFRGHPYQQTISLHSTALALPTDVAHADGINRWAAAWQRGQAVFAYQCQMDRGSVGDPLGSELTPVVWTNSFLVLQDMMPDTYCGGAHSSFSVSYTTWSLDKGQVVNTWSWLRNGQKALLGQHTGDGPPPPSALMKLIRAAHPRNVKGDDCGEAMDHVEVMAPYPTGKGLVFGTSFFYAMRACGDDVLLSWKQLLPHLSLAGKTAMQAWN